MKKKIISALIAAAAAFTLSISVFAADSNPTFCFDTEEGLSYVKTFGNTAETGLTYAISEDEAYSGNSLAISESFSSESSNTNCGIYFDAADFGLDNFSNYNITMKVYCTSASAKSTSLLELFTDGDVYDSVNISTSNSGSWQEYTISVPTTSKNNKFGINVPITDSFDGIVCYVDDITISNIYNATIENVGDVSKGITSEGTNAVVSVITVLIFVVLIIGVVVGVALYVFKMIKKYR